jgi:ferredoxin--NADP+ reductase
LIGEMARNQLVYYPTVTREPFERQGRLTTLIETGQIFRDLGIDQTRFDPASDRVMLCGSMDMIKDMAKVCETQGLVEGSNSEPGDFVLERAFVG